MAKADLLFRWTWILGFRNFSGIVENRSSRSISSQSIQFYSIKRLHYSSSSLLNRSHPSICIEKKGPFSQGISSMSTLTVNEESLRNKYKPRECKFNTPYGHVAALEWGQPEATNKILCVHGWLDNAGSFERLVPFILDHNDNANQYHIISMDQPGVGLSSHKPAGTEYTQFTSIIEMRRIAQQLNWEKMTLISHSFGAHLSFIYASIYPKQVENLVSIDLAHPITRQVNSWNVSLANSLEEYFRWEYNYEDDPTTNIRVPVYSEVDAVKRLMDGHSNSLTKESAEVLLKRGAKKQSWGYTFTRDMRLRFLGLEFRLDDDLMLQHFDGPFRPNLFIIRANRSPYHRPESVRLRYYELFQKTCPIFRDKILDGTHHLHMNTPEPVAQEINQFLDDVRSVSRGKNVETPTKSNL